MDNTVKEVLEFIEENDVKFIRLAFCDLFGVQKNISIMPTELLRAFKEGITFDAWAIDGFTTEEKSDLLLFPDPTTLSVLPWRPQQGRVVRFYCNIKNPDGSDFYCDSRSILKRSIKQVQEAGYVCRVGAECEFYLFKTDENGDPTKEPYDNGGYFDIAPIDKCENVRREICLCLEEMGIQPETSHHEQGPGQNEIDFKFSDTLSSADNLLTFKSVVKAIATRNGLYASFMPKPILEKSGNGLHINLSLMKNGLNMFKAAKEEQNEIVESFIAGILERTSEITAFLNPIANSYERFGCFEAPKYVSWSHQNRSQLVRIPAATGDYVRMELRSPDPTVNPYLAYALIISAGMDGIKRELPLPKEVNENLYTADDTITKKLELLPVDLKTALARAKESSFIQEVLGQQAFHNYISLKEKEVMAFELALDKKEFYQDTYFKNM